MFAVRLFVLKPDGIGDFILATGALRALANEVGEKNLTLCVRTVLVPLARHQFPRATVLDLPTAAQRRVLNLFVRNFLACLPLFRKLRGMRFEASISLRSMRNYLETALFFAPRARRFVACENRLVGHRTRHVVESLAARARGAELIDYPAPPARVPLEIEAHRRVVARVLERDVEIDDVMPRLTATPATAGHWICAPVSKLAAKDFPFERWVEIFLAVRPLAEAQKLLLAGAREDAPRLEIFARLLRENGFQNCEVIFPESLVHYVDLIAGAALVLTIDTAAAHMATALDRPTLILFSELHRGMFAPWHRSQRQNWLVPQPGTKRKKWHAGISTPAAAAAIRDLVPQPAA